MHHPDLGRVDVLVLPEHRLSLSRFRGEVRTAMVLEALWSACESHPDITGFHCICDLRQHTGHLGVEGMNEIMALRHGTAGPRLPARSVLISHDSGMIFTARYLDHLAPHVTHSVCPDPAAALARATGGAIPEAGLAFLTAP